jgi:hypothetical protein
MIAKERIGMLDIKAQQAGIAALTQDIDKTLEILKAAENVAEYAFSNPAAGRRLAEYYKNASRWLARAIGVLNFIDGLNSYGPVFSEDEAGRIDWLRGRADEYLRRLNAIYTKVSQLQ